MEGRMTLWLSLHLVQQLHHTVYITCSLSIWQEQRCVQASRGAAGLSLSNLHTEEGAASGFFDYNSHLEFSLARRCLLAWAEV